MTKVDLLPTWKDGVLIPRHLYVDAMRKRFDAIGLRLRCEEHGCSLRHLEFIRWEVMAGRISDDKS